MRSLRVSLLWLAAALPCLSLPSTVLAAERDPANRSSSLPVDPVLSNPDQVTLPGPLRSLLRMAGVSQQIPPESVLPLLARSVFFLGYQRGQETEFLFLLQRYVRQARELQAMAGSSNEIRITHCSEAGPLLQVLGYHQHGDCGSKDVSLVTLNPERAFVTVDSGFPLTRLEEALQNDTPFVYAYAPSQVPVLLKATEWTNLSLSGKKSGARDLLEVLVHDPQVARMYWAVSKMDPETGLALQRTGGLQALLPYANVLDFYGSELCIRSKRVLVPGGPAAEDQWKALVGVSPRSPGEFVTRLVSQDRGWMALYFDTLARVDSAQQAHLTQGARLKQLYEAFQGAPSEGAAAAAAFRKAPLLLILFSRQQWLPDGEPRLPGDVGMWRLILTRRGRHVGSPEQVFESLVANARADSDDGPLQIYLYLSSLNDGRSAEQQVSPRTMLLIASNYTEYSTWYPVFSEFPQLSDASITQFIHLAQAIDHCGNEDLRGDALGIFQANLGLWQILARQGEIPESQQDSSWQAVTRPFESIGSSVQLLDAGEKSLAGLMTAATGKSAYSQQELIDLLAGPAQTDLQKRRIHTEMAERMRSVMDDQRLTSLDTLAELSRGLDAMAHGAPRPEKLRAAAGNLREFELPRPIFTESEKFEWAPDMARQRHAGLQVHTDLSKAIDQPNTPEKLEAARGQLTPFFRDTLVGLNYAYYEPPGSQILHINPMFVRSHDFAGATIIGDKHIWQASSVFGTGASAGGGAYLIGSLASLPYVLARAEQNFISPTNVQALIWEDLVPSLLATSTLTRWWNVSPQELHAVALYQETGEELIAASASDPELREKVMTILDDRLQPKRLWYVETAVLQKSTAGALARLTPADTFYLTEEFRRRYPQEAASAGPAAQSLDQLANRDPAEVSLERISRDFGIPHPALEQTYGRQLVNGKLFPAFSGNCNRLLGESWDSNNLYWARLADERNDPPQSLNVLSPQLTRLMISKIFATDIEDWPAVDRAMHEAGSDLMHGKIASLRGTEVTTQH